MILPNVKFKEDPTHDEYDLNMFEMNCEKEYGITDKIIEEYKYECNTTREGALQILYNEYVERI